MAKSIRHESPEPTNTGSQSVRYNSVSVKNENRLDESLLQTKNLTAAKQPRKKAESTNRTIDGPQQETLTLPPMANPAHTARTYRDIDSQAQRFR